MKRAISWVYRAAQYMAATMMAVMFLTFVLQIAIRYTARLEWIAEAIPLLDPSRFGWTLEFCLAIWVWIIFFGNAFVVRERDHVAFDILYTYVRPAVRKWFAIVSAVAITVGLLLSIEPTWSKFFILRLKKTATLSHIFGDWIRMRDIYAIYMVFLVVVPIRYAWRAWYVYRHGAEIDAHHHFEELAE